MSANICGLISYRCHSKLRELVVLCVDLYDLLDCPVVTADAVRLQLLQFIHLFSSS